MLCRPFQRQVGAVEQGLGAKLDGLLPLADRLDDGGRHEGQACVAVDVAPGDGLPTRHLGERAHLPDAGWSSHVCVRETALSRAVSTVRGGLAPPLRTILVSTRRRLMVSGTKRIRSRMLLVRTPLLRAGNRDLEGDPDAVVVVVGFNQSLVLARLAPDDRLPRIWRREGLKAPQKQRPRSRLWLNDGSCVRLRPGRINHVWSYEFVTAMTHDGRSLRLLTLLDEFSRERRAIQAARRLGRREAIETLAEVMKERGAPEHIRSDNGPEFVPRSRGSGSIAAAAQRSIALY